MLSQRDERCAHDTMCNNLVMMGLEEEKHDTGDERDVPLLEKGQ